jgi:hypothetical protein
MRQARYVGDAKILLQLSWTAATVNLKRLFKELAGAIAPKNRTEATSAT